MIRIYPGGLPGVLALGEEKHKGNPTASSIPRAMALSVGGVGAFGLLFSCFSTAAGTARICALQTGGPVRVVSRHRSSNSPQANPLPNKGTEGGRGGGGGGGSGPSSSAVLTFESRDMFKVSRMAGRPGKRKKSSPRLSNKTKRLRSKVGG